MVEVTIEKRLELLNETNPKIRRVGILQDPTDRAGAAQISAARNAAQAFGKELTVVEVRNPEQFGAAFARLKQARIEALLFLATPFSFTYRKAFISEATKNRWVTASSFKEHTEDGGVFSYGADVADACRRSAVYVDKILNGARPSELPVQQQVKFELVINLKAAKAIGL